MRFTPQNLSCYGDGLDEEDANGVMNWWYGGGWPKNEDKMGLGLLIHTGRERK